MIASTAIALAERGLVPLPGLRLGIRSLLKQRLRGSASEMSVEAFAKVLAKSPIALDTDKANEQHYELPPEFFSLVLGAHLKYSGAYWPQGTTSLDAAELRMLELSCKRAKLEDGQDILELGCGWGSLTLYMAHMYPNSRITAVSNSAPQRRYIEARAPNNVTVVTADMNHFAPEQTFDRIVSVEMFEHMRNYEELLGRIRSWLRPEGRLFVHVFCHKEHAYPFEVEGEDNWMGRYFFTGGIMPSFGLLRHFDQDMAVEEHWPVDGSHYSKTARAWRKNLEDRRPEVMEVLRATYGHQADTWYHRWRLFFLSCEELFGYDDGKEWLVGHYRFAPTPVE
ncbi:MAG: cyclopropane-fatty-acyl-phospholipid synthase [Gemmatimonadetes bacterium]|nr:cyclopropane-fatty-acyl-phospholipid synthase [Gemmatimonadota bacterium]MDA1102946.1 cyclopropane-fatty-acyl-phospholipid synthase [Gemmatimonadota bacterium]